MSFSPFKFKVITDIVSEYDVANSFYDKYNWHEEQTFYLLSGSGMTTVHYQDLDMEGVDFSKDFNFTFPPLLAGISSFDVGHINY